MKTRRPRFAPPGESGTDCTGSRTSHGSRTISAEFREVCSLFRERADDRCRVRSWIFRHRLRLRAIYGQRPDLAPPSAVPLRKPAALIDGLAPGESGRRGSWYVMRPRNPAA